MKTLPPLRFRPVFYQAIEKEVAGIFYRALYRRLQREIDKSKIYQNRSDVLVEAIRIGRVEYENGFFTGEFSAAISKRLMELGAEFNGRRKAWVITSRAIPSDVMLAVAEANAKYQALASSLVRTLDETDLDKEVENSGLESAYFGTTKQMDKDFVDAVKSIVVTPQLSRAQLKTIASEWTNNLKLYIQDWTQSEIVSLRRKVEVNGFSGQRFSNLIKLIQDSYSVSKSKATFLARQETSLLMSKMRETRYSDIGIYQYRWSGSLDQRERPDHLALQGKVFEWSKPPITDKRTGARNNPGEDFNCRCQAIPIIPGDEWSAGASDGRE